MRFAYSLPWNDQGRYEPKDVTIELEGVSEDDHIIKAITNAKKFYEHDLLYHIAMRGPRRGIFVDVGANIGNHSVYFATFLADSVIAVEPNPATAKVLRHNVNANQLKNVIVHEGGLAAQSGRGRMVVPDGTENYGAARVMTRETTTNTLEQNILLTTLDELVSAQAQRLKQPVNFIKIDVEGMEMEVLQGAARVLQEHRPHLAVELNDERERQVACDYLKQFNYKAVGQFCASPTFYFLDPKRHQLRDLPSRWACSWHMGKLKSLRSLVGWK